MTIRAPRPPLAPELAFVLALLLATGTRATQLGTYFFYWHDAPSNNFDASAIIYDPYGGTSPFPGSNTWYSSLDPDWYAREFRDMEMAGLELAFPVHWGDNAPWFDNGTVAFMVEGLEASGTAVRLGLFDDTTSEACDYNKARQLGYTPSPPPPLSDSDGLWFWFYDLKWKPFFETVPRERWATHDGSPVSEGGRPVVVAYTGAWFADAHFSDEMWSTVKASFVRDFGVEPFLVLENSWFALNSEVGAVADGRYAWGAAVGGWNSFAHGGYRVNAVGAGYDDHLIRPETPTYRARENGRLLSSSWAAMPSGAELVLVETWNELWEGTGVCRLVDYPDEDAGQGTLDELFYMEELRELAATKPGRPTYRASLVDLEVPDRVGPGSVLGFTVRNEGTRTWNGPNFRLGSRFALAPGREDSVLVEFRLGEVPTGTSVATGELIGFIFTVPESWTSVPGPGDWILRLDMVEDGVTWFEWQGDRPIHVPTTIAAAAPEGPSLAAVRRAEVLERGGTLLVDARLGNPGPTPATWKVWIDAFLPGGAPVPLLPPRSVLVEAGSALDASLAHTAPPAVPGGLYDYRISVGGTYPVAEAACDLALTIRDP